MAQSHRVTNLQATAGDAFGHAVSVAGSGAVVGAWKEDGACPQNPACNSGGAHVFEYDDLEGWRIVDHIVSSDDGAGDNFGHAVAIADDLVVVGSPGAGLGGAVYTFVHDDALGWVEEGRLSFSNEGAGDRYGYAIAIEMPYLVVGSPGSDLRENGAGVVFVYRRHESGAWVQADLLVASDSDVGDSFGHAVGIRDGTIAVTAPGDDEAGVDTGSTYFFEPDVTGGWSSAGKVSAGGTSDDADCAASAATASTLGFTGKKGQVVTSLRTDAGWETGNPIEPTVADSSFGCAVAYAEDVLLIGAWGSSDFRKAAGSVTAYEPDTAGVWMASQFLWPDSLASGDEFGRRVATDGRWALVGAPGSDFVAENAGAAYFFDLGQVLAVGRPTLTSPADGSSEVTLSPLLVWSAVQAAATYELQVATDAAVQSLVYDTTGLATASQLIEGLTVGSTYYWRVRATTADGVSPWSSVFRFTTTTTNVATEDLRPANHAGVHVVGLYPNPARPGQRMHVEFRVAAGDRRSQVDVAVFDLTGRLVRKHRAVVDDDRGEATVNTERLPVGAYVLRVQYGGSVDSRLLFVR